MAKTKTTYVLDTNVLISSHYAINAFDEHDVIITEVTLEELDRHKNALGEKGANAREVVKILKDKYTKSNYIEYLFDRGYIEAQAMAYMRGCSIPDTWIIIDEAQNMSPTQAFGVISRAGHNCKIILVGDPGQIDNPRLDSRTNRLTYASEKMKGSPVCWQVTFEEKECVRSPIALEAINKMSLKGMGGI